MPSVEELVERLLAGNRRALSRLLTLIENDAPAGRRALAQLYPRSGVAHTVGLTGSAGSGKSTLSGALARVLRGAARRSASWPSTRRARSARARSWATASACRTSRRTPACSSAAWRRAATSAARAVDGGRRHRARRLRQDVVLVETVGAGQDEVEVAAMADTTVVVVTPGTGDDVQAMKAGMMEIADILVVNKCDLPNADLLARQLASIVDAAPGARRTPILKAAGGLNEGVDALADAIEEHRAYIAQAGVREQHRREQRAAPGAGAGAAAAASTGCSRSRRATGGWTRSSSGWRSARSIRTRRRMKLMANSVRDP